MTVDRIGTYFAFGMWALIGYIIYKGSELLFEDISYAEYFTLFWSVGGLLLNDFWAGLCYNFFRKDEEDDY